MSVSLSRPTYIVLASSSFVVVTWRLLQWRARKRAKKTVERVKNMVREGAPLVSRNYKHFLEECALWSVLTLVYVSTYVACLYCRLTAVIHRCGNEF
jgi:hypothetical protein